jgi:hypothetical protein
LLPELASGPALLRANAAMEIVTIAAILAGTLLGSRLVVHPVLQMACLLLAGVYGVAALCSAGANGRKAARPQTSMAFGAATARLLADPPARHSLQITSVFWAAAAVLQFLLIDWARSRLGLSLAGAALLPGALAIGMVAGSVLAGRTVRPHARTHGALLALSLGAAIAILPITAHVWSAAALLLASGVLAGALLVPMNATLQARGAALVGAGMSVAVQNCLENGLSLLFLAAYGLALAAGLQAAPTLVALGVLVMLLLLAALWGGRHDHA